MRNEVNKRRKGCCSSCNPNCYKTFKINDALSSLMKWIKINRDGISPDKSKYDAISKFQTPKNIKELRLTLKAGRLLEQ